MPGFFNSENKWRAMMQVANGLALLLAAYNMASDPEAAWDDGFEIILHAFNVLTFAINDNAIQSITNAALNFSSLGSIFAWATSNCSTRPLAVNMADALLHLTNAVTSICYKAEPAREAAPQNSI